MSRINPYTPEHREVYPLLYLKSTPVKKNDLKDFESEPTDKNTAFMKRTNEYFAKIKTDEKKKLEFTKRIIRKFFRYIIIMQEDPAVTKDKVINTICNLLSLKNLADTAEAYTLKPTIRHYGILDQYIEKILLCTKEFISNTDSFKNIQGVMTSLGNKIKLPEVPSNTVTEFIEGFALDARDLTVNLAVYGLDITKILGQITLLLLLYTGFFCITYIIGIKLTENMIIPVTNMVINHTMYLGQTFTPQIVSVIIGLTLVSIYLYVDEKNRYKRIRNESSPFVVSPPRVEEISDGVKRRRISIRKRSKKRSMRKRK